MLFFLISFVAGILTVLAPCVLPLLPIVIGSTEAESKRRISKKSITVITALSVSVILFTLLLKSSTLLIDIPDSFWKWFSGGIISILGILMIFPNLWTNIPFVNRLKKVSNKNLAEGYKQNNRTGDILIGFSLGPVFSTCSPVYLFIIATVLPAAFWTGFLYLLGFTLGMAVSLLLIAYFGQSLISLLSRNSRRGEIIKKTLGVLVLIVGIAIITGYDKKIETRILDSGYGATINLEQNLINQFEENQMNKKEAEKNDVSYDIPSGVLRSFSDTDFSKADASIEKILSGGPGKDGIPAIDDPEFVPISTFQHADDVLAVVLEDGGDIKAYPYNILTWHEIVNDEVNGKDVAVTFCPLCGSALVFDRGVIDNSTLGVSGFLIESNMVMYDRKTESLWQQATGRVVAGELFGTELPLVNFQLMTVGEVKDKYPNAQILSEDTGHRRDYSRNPYSGYEESNQFFFSPSVIDARIPSKTIMLAFKNSQNTPIAVVFEHVVEGQAFSISVDGEIFDLRKENGEVSITNTSGESVPFYFEMWFSWFVQNGEKGRLIDLN